MNYNFWIPVLIGVASFVLALYTLIKTERWKRREKIRLNILIDESHAFTKFVEDSNLPDDVKERVSSLNHNITYTLTIFKGHAQKWVSVNKPVNEWPLWEQKLEISMDKYRKKASKKK